MKRPWPVWIARWYPPISSAPFCSPPVRRRVSPRRFFPRASRAACREVRGISSEATLLLRAYCWPGNLRELYEMLLGACQRAKADTIEPGDLPFHLRHAPLPAEKPLSLDAVLEQVE